MKRTQPGRVALAAFLVLLSSGPAGAAAGDCGQPVSSGPKPLTSDCLYILRSAVGITDCELCLCDTDGGETITASDAQRCLRVAVGLTAILACEDCATTTTLVTTTTLTGASSTSTTTTTLDVPNEACPGSVEWTTHAGYGPVCEWNADCAVGACDDESGRCRTETSWDVGWTGYGHGTDLDEGSVERLTLHCDSETAPCGQCEVTGIDPTPGNCRCANDTRTTCDEPLQPDADDCASCSGGANNGKPCHSAGDCPGGSCSGAAICQCFQSPPIPVSAGGTPFCFVPRFDALVTGTVNVDSGASMLVTSTRLVVYTGLTDAPCPTCGGACSNAPSTFCVRDEDCPEGGNCNDDPAPNDGERGGVCSTSNGTGIGQSCDKSAFNSSFPAFETGAGGGWYSLDCMPDASLNATGQGLLVKSVRTTGAVTLPSELACPAPAAELECSCLFCSNDVEVPCATHEECAESPSICSLSNVRSPFLCDSNSDCTDKDAGPCSTGIMKCSRALSIGCESNADCVGKDVGECATPTCSSIGSNGASARPNQCENFACTDLGDGAGECTTGPDIQYCAGMVEAGGQGIIPCFGDIDCETGIGNVGPCSLVERLRCFPYDIEATGSADAQNPVLAETYCVATMSTAGKNAAFGLPGPARLERETTLRSFCDADPEQLYTPDVGGCEP